MVRVTLYQEFVCFAHLQLFYSLYNVLVYGSVPFHVWVCVPVIILDGSGAGRAVFCRWNSPRHEFMRKH